jgi:hypothetical protein
MFVLTFGYELLCAVNYVMDIIAAVLSTLTRIIFTFILFIFIPACAIIIKQVLKFCDKCFIIFTSMDFGAASQQKW